jgi:hypothetical protein
VRLAVNPRSYSAWKRKDLNHGPHRPHSLPVGRMASDNIASYRLSTEGSTAHRERGNDAFAGLPSL